MFCYHWSDFFKIAHINIPTSLTTMYADLIYGGILYCQINALNFINSRVITNTLKT